ncbi:hypothetical protein HMPREF9629_02266 [Peptoanaerobacter stomatis]|uniref:Uncharacterized protein n=1 Tax=Peptoanaerobacter stomatis TaxID=796937 RepID=G9X2C7_9FIRM|nr:hypothetical protein HMPREF9629_02266 [Peptoanaerobacter stomatis]
MASKLTEEQLMFIGQLDISKMGEYGNTRL